MTDVRLAVRDDLPALTAAVELAAAELEAKYGTARMDLTIGQVVEYGITSDQAVVVAYEGGVLIGWCSWVILPGGPADMAHGVGTWVRPGCRQAGLSRRMRELATAKAKQCGAQCVTGTVENGNEAGMASVLAEGFEPVATVVRKRL